MNSSFYRAFEDRHRGSRELIQSRQEIYLGFLRGVAAAHPGAGVVDLGCGRGEWLELLGKQGIAAAGVDLDDGMLQACRERGLNATRQDALTFLQGLPAGSQLAVSGFHLAEHLPFETLGLLVAEALRVLRPGGLLILETPNPENLTMGACAFYMDPTHQRPLPPALLSFLLEFHGFARVKTLRLQEAPVLRDPATPISLLDVLSGVSPDYAVVGQKARDASHAWPADAAAAVDAAFAAEYGLNLNELAQRYERQWQQRLHQALGVADMARKAATATQLAQGQAALRMQRALADIDAVYSSRSWRITRPLRWAANRARAIRQEGPGRRVRRFVVGAVKAVLRLAARTVTRHPRLRQAVGAAIRLTGTARLVERLRQRLAAIPHRQPAAELSPEARRLRAVLADASKAKDAGGQP